MSRRTARAELEEIGRAALAAVDAETVVARALKGGARVAIGGRRLPDGAGVLVVALGKAAAGMASAAVGALGDRVVGGIVVTKDGHGAGHAALPVRETGHPVPDARGERAAREVLDLVAAARPDDVLLVLLSGGASALTGCPAPGLLLSDLAATTEALLAGGADIAETNAVRKHLSSFAGGRLAQAAAARRIDVLAISDVPGDAIDVIGSGPCAPDATCYAEALEVLARRAGSGRVPPAVLDHLSRGAQGALPETPKPGDARLARVRHTIVASNADAVAAAADRARALGRRAVALGGALRGEARVAGVRLAALADAVSPDARVCVVAGGETTVTLAGAGRGGRNQELALAAAIAFDARTSGRDVALLALGTDGTDGPTDAAGAYADAETVARGRRAGVEARAALADNDAYGFFAREGGLVVTGPTGTNVMDLALLYA